MYLNGIFRDMLEHFMCEIAEDLRLGYWGITRHRPISRTSVFITICDAKM